MRSDSSVRAGGGGNPRYSGILRALRYSDDFEKGITAAVNHDGDSDSTGAVTGNILGAALGFEAIPQKISR